KAIREPWRLAAVYLQRTFGNDFTQLDLPFTRRLDRKRWSTLNSMIATGVNCPETSSMGRLFDAIAALRTLRNSINYEGQAAIELESIADPLTDYSYEIEFDGPQIRVEKVIREVVEELLNGVPVTQISADFHFSVARLIARIAQRTRDERHLNRI